MSPFRRSGPSNRREIFSFGRIRIDISRRHVADNYPRVAESSTLTSHLRQHSINSMPDPVFVRFDQSNIVPQIDAKLTHRPKRRSGKPTTRITVKGIARPLCIHTRRASIFTDRQSVPYYRIDEHIAIDLSEEERGWAIAIKEALTKEDADLATSISDFGYAHHAIIAKDKVSKALKRIRRLDTFRKEHGIPIATTSEEAMEKIQSFEAGSPGMFLAFGQDDEGHYVSTWNYSAFLPANYQKPEDWKNCFAAFYYLFDAMQPDIAAVRSGIIMLADAEHLGWKNFSLEMEKHAAHLYQDAYPIRIKHMIMLHSPLIFKAMYALCKPFLSKKVKDAIQLNGKVPEVQEVFPKSILATTMGGYQSTTEMEEEMRKALKLRYSNEASFRL